MVYNKYSGDIMKKNLVRKRLIAFIIDIFIVGMIASVIFMGNNKTDDNVSKELTNLISDYSSEKITTKEYMSKYSDIIYETTETNFNQDLVYLVISVGYFLIFQYLNDGASIGKKIMKIRIVNKNREKISFWQLLIRVCLVNEVLAMTIMLLLVKISSGTTFLIGYGLVNLFRNIIVIICGLSMIIDKKNMALHDKISNSYVIMDK